MEGMLLDKEYNLVEMIDIFDSFIWTDRFLGYGDFEIFMPAGLGFQTEIQQDYYITTKDSERYMIVEKIELDTEPEIGTHLTVSGRSLEAILVRRIIWGQVLLRGNLQDGIEKLLNENAIKPSDPARIIPKLSFKRSTDERITSLTVEAQFIGDNLYDAIYILCEYGSLGFRVLPVGNGGFEFELYLGEDRSYAQDSLPSVVFSPAYENLLSSNYIETKMSFRNAALVGGEGEGAAQVRVEALSVSGIQGLDRREIYVDASGLSSKTEDGDLSPAVYRQQLSTKGLEELSKTYGIAAFEGEIDATRQFVYGVDFFIGDIVQVVNEYGFDSQSRIVELIVTHDSGGISFIPTFESIN